MDDFDTFDEVEEQSFDISERKLVIRVDKRNARKAITYIEEWDLDIEEMKQHLKKLKTTLGCNGSVKNKTIDGNKVVIFQLQGDKRVELMKYLIENGIKENNITVIG